MADFLTTKQALAAIEEVIDSATKRLVLLSPYQRIGDAFRARIAAAAKRGVDISIVYGNQDDDVGQIHALGELPNTRVLYCALLHAKCYLNEHAMVITSLNLLVSSEKNWEMGVRLTSKEPAYAAGVREAELIIANSEPRTPKLPSGGGLSRVPRRAAGGAGHCIRCGCDIPLDPSRPLCAGCFEVWRQWENWSFEEKFCHECGRPERTSFARPRCETCFVGATSQR